VLLLLPAWVGADTSYVVETEKVLTWEQVNKGPILTCDLAYQNCEIQEPSAFPCYQRMREAMKAMDLQFISKGYHPLGKRFGDNGAIVYKPKQWNTTMKDCVEGE